MFKLTTLNTDAPLPTNEDGTTNYSEDLFGKKAFITGSGQLHGETYAQAFGKIYTFGPKITEEIHLCVRFIISLRIFIKMALCFPFLHGMKSHRKSWTWSCKVK